MHFPGTQVLQVWSSAGQSYREAELEAREALDIITEPQPLSQVQLFGAGLLVRPDGVIGSPRYQIS